MDLRLALASVSLLLGAGCGGGLATSGVDDAGADVSLPGHDGGGGGHDATGGGADAAGPADAGGANDAEAGGDGACSLPAPVNHRPVPAACDATRPPGINTGDGGLGPCNTDSECTGDAGTNGRCTPTNGGFGPTCTYDTCTTDTGCTSGTICVCGTPTPGPGRYPNACLPSNCAVDSDCGPGGSCSPSFGTCGAFSGVVGYYCHRPCDACTNDSQCPATTQGPGYCAWNPQVGQWACSNSLCVG